MPEVDLLADALLQAVQDHISTVPPGLDLPSVAKEVAATVMTGLQEVAQQSLGV